MKRRTFLKCIALAICIAPSRSFSHVLHAGNSTAGTRAGAGEDSQSGNLINDQKLKDYLTKVRNPDSPHPADIVLSNDQCRILDSVVARLERVCGFVGYGNFAIIDLEQTLKVAADIPAVGGFPVEETEFLEMVYSRDASDYGFFGEKQVVKINQKIDQQEIVKIEGNGNFLFRGEAEEKYQRIVSNLGNEAVLTSGIRGIIKQFYLFLKKASRYGGNLSLASRSLAPPGYSYHATGDFDIGQRGFGEANFSEQFTHTSVFKMLTEQGFVEYRYKRDNLLGVRYEPWHIKLKPGSHFSL